MKILFTLGLLILSGCVSKGQLEEILTKIDHNNRVLLKRLEALENEKREEGKQKDTSTGKLN